MHKNLDLRNPHAILCTYIDLSKAFNRINHYLVIQDLCDMHTPAWLLTIMISYLSERKMKMSYLNNESELKNLTAGSPQGAYLGGIIFIIKFNGAFVRPPVPRPMAAPLGYSEDEKAKYIDDGTVPVSIPLKKSLVNDPILREKPLNFHERTGHILPKENNLLQYYINDFEEFVVENDMKINREKTNVMLIKQR